MAHSEKSVLLGFFIEHEVHRKSKEERKDLFGEESLHLRGHELCRVKIKDNLADLHVQNYYNDYAKPFQIDAKTIPHEQNSDTVEVVMDAEESPLLDDVVVELQEKKKRAQRSMGRTL